MILPSCSTDEADESTDHCSNHGSDGLICWWHWWHSWADCTDGADFLSIMHNRFWWHSHASCALMLFILISCHFNSFHLISFQLISYQSSHPCNLMLMQLQLPMSFPWHSHWLIWVSLMPISWKTNDVSCFVDHSSLISHIFSHKTICRLSSLAHWLHPCWYHLSPCAPTIVNQSTVLFWMYIMQSHETYHSSHCCLEMFFYFFYLMPSGPDNLDGVQISSQPFLGWAGMKVYEMKSSSFALLTHLMIWWSPKIPKFWIKKNAFSLLNSL